MKFSFLNNAYFNIGFSLMLRKFFYRKKMSNKMPASIMPFYNGKQNWF